MIKMARNDLHTASLNHDCASCGLVLQFLIARKTQGYVFEDADYDRHGLEASLESGLLENVSLIYCLLKHVWIVSIKAITYAKELSTIPMHLLWIYRHKFRWKWVLAHGKLLKADLQGMSWNPFQ